MIYYCDPIKNKECSHSGCFLSGGSCYLTKHKEYSPDGNILRRQAELCLKDMDRLMKIRDSE